MNRSTKQIASAKAELRQVLTGMLNRLPPSVRDGGVVVTQAWKRDHSAAQRAFGPRGTEADLTAAIANLRRYDDPDKVRQMLEEVVHA